MSLSYRLGSRSLFERPNEDSVKPKRVVFLSVEGSCTELDYFKLVEKYRKQLGIDSLVHVEVLRKFDTKSDPVNVLALLEEYIHFRENNEFSKEIDTLRIRRFETDFIRSYMDDPSNIPSRQRNQFEAVLREERIDLLYLDFLSKFRGDDDKFAIVIDRDCGSHSLKHMTEVVEKCQQRNYLYFISNPCMEFWLLLHVSDVAREYANHLEEILNNRKEHGHTYVEALLHDKVGHRKSLSEKIFVEHYLPNIDLAIKRAQGFAPKEELLVQLGSNMGELFCLLRAPHSSVISST